MAYNEIAEALGIEDNSGIAHHIRVLVGAALVGNQLERVDGRIRSVYFLSQAGKGWLKKAGLSEPERLRLLIEA